MEQLDSTIINTAVPQWLEVARRATEPEGGRCQYILSLAVFLPASGWAANRFGARSVFGFAVTVFTVSSVLVARVSLHARVQPHLAGVGAALMVPVGRSQL